MFYYFNELTFTIQEFLFTVPYVSHISIIKSDDFRLFVFVALIVLLILLWLLLFALIRALAKAHTRRTVMKHFSISDLDKFRVTKMRKRGSKYYSEDTMNNFRLVFPRWKYANEDGTHDNKKRSKKVLWGESVLWLHAGRKNYVLRCRDPWDMMYLVHELRESGINILPCSHELDKQERLDREHKGPDEVIGAIIDRLDGNRSAFVELCRQRLLIRGYRVENAPANNSNIDLFIKRDSRPILVRCLLAPRSHLTSLSDMQSFRSACNEFFSEDCMLITTGHITVAAAGCARENSIDVIMDARLVDLLEQDKTIGQGKEFRRWEVTDEDVKYILPNDLHEFVLRH